MCKKNPWPKIFRNVDKIYINWQFIDSIEFFHPELPMPLVYSAQAFRHQIDSNSVIDLQRINSNKVKLVFNKEKIKADVNEIVDNYYLKIRATDEDTE